MPSVLKYKLPILCLLLWCSSVVCAQSVHSPDGKCRFDFSLQRGKPVSTLTIAGENVSRTLPLGLQLVGDSPDLTQDFIVKSMQMAEPSTSLPYNEMAVELMQRTTAREMTLRVRAGNDSIWICYEIPKQNTLPSLKVNINSRIIELQTPASTPWETIYRCSVSTPEHLSFWQRMKKWFTRKKNNT